MTSELLNLLAPSTDPPHVFITTAPRVPVKDSRRHGLKRSCTVPKSDRSVPRYYHGICDCRIPSGIADVFSGDQRRLCRRSRWSRDVPFHLACITGCMGSKAGCELISTVATQPLCHRKHVQGSSWRSPAMTFMVLSRV